MMQRKLFFLVSIGALTFVLLLVGYSYTVSAQEDLVARGKYLTNLCVGCHTPAKAEYNIPDPTKFTKDQLLTIALHAANSLDMEHSFSGGRVFPLPDGTILMSRNLTPDKETGIGNWSDEEIENAIRFGISKNGNRLHPLMPYRNFNNLSKEDVKAIIAFLRTLPAVNHAVPPRDTSNDNFPPVEAPAGGLPDKAPSTSDPVAYGKYLVTAWLSCGDCHTPIDQKTGAPVLDLFMAGGQPYEGPWGIVYAGNITPHKETGIGNWTDDQIKRAVAAGIANDGRRLVVMPWEDYAKLTPEDLNGVVAYLRSLKPVDNKIPPNSIQDIFIQKVDTKDLPPVAGNDTGNNASSNAPANNNNTLLIVVGIIVAVFILGGIFVGMRGSNKSS